MWGLPLVRPLEDDWRETLDAVARAHGYPSSREPARLGAQVAELSAAYNDAARARAAAARAGAARLGFSFARDVPKGTAAVRELVATGRLRLDGTLRVLDVGAGLGATTWGVVRALEAAGQRGTVEATWIDADARALELGKAVASARTGRGAIDVRPRILTRSVSALDDLPRFDLVLCCQLLSELDVGTPDAERVERHAALLGAWLERRVDDHGALVVVEPALRDRTRHLHRVRDALAARPGVTVFAPCLHAAPCPALEREGDWCHEDLPVDLPSWLVPVARAAGLRHEGLTFSYLVLRKDGARLADAVLAPAGGARLRVVSDAMPSKGKREAFLCGELRRDGALVAGRVRAMRLDRDRAPGNSGWDVAARGDVLVVEPGPELDRARVGRETSVRVAGGSGADDDATVGESR
jgi:SAM-dependent methyltransferase